MTSVTLSPLTSVFCDALYDTLVARHGFKEFIESLPEGEVDDICKEIINHQPSAPVAKATPVRKAAASGPKKTKAIPLTVEEHNARLSVNYTPVYNEGKDSCKVFFGKTGDKDGKRIGEYCMNHSPQSNNVCLDCSTTTAGAKIAAETEAATFVSANYYKATETKRKALHRDALKALGKPWVPTAEVKGVVAAPAAAQSIFPVVPYDINADYGYNTRNHFVIEKKVINGKPGQHVIGVDVELSGDMQALTLADFETIVSMGPQVTYDETYLDDEALAAHKKRLESTNARKAITGGRSLRTVTTTPVVTKTVDSQEDTIETTKPYNSNEDNEGERSVPATVTPLPAREPVKRQTPAATTTQRGAATTTTGLRRPVINPRQGTA